MSAKRLGRRLLMGLIVLAFLVGAAFWIIRKVGRWLVVNDSLQHARAIVVLSGLLPYRAMEAAEIYKQGWAPEVWLFKDDPRGAVQAFAQLGIHHITEDEYDQQVLERLGVPRTAIRVLDPPTTNTQNEFALLREELRRQGGDKVILVTSPVHTRRSKAIWRLVVGDYPQAILRYDSSEPTDPDHWWRATRDIQDVEHEVLGLIDAHLGFAVRPRQE
jgi:uncharacterized SAM-binding protein YcdF (DUF218 family)